MIKKLSLTESLEKIKKNGGMPNIETTLFEGDKGNLRLINELNDNLKNTKFYDDKVFLKESANLLLLNNREYFLEHLYENALMLDALLDICVLTFSIENSKLGSDIVTFSLPAGWTCPFAEKCLQKVERERVIDPEKIGTVYKNVRGNEMPYTGDVSVSTGPMTLHKCYASSQEMQYDDLRNNRWANYDLLRSAGGEKEQADLIIKSLKFLFEAKGFKKDVRIHESGDFYNAEYLRAWMRVAREMPNNTFYAFSKSIPYIIANKDEIDKIPNFILTLSSGGTYDKDLDKLNIKEATVFTTPEDALKAGVQIDLDDTLAREKTDKSKNFGLVMHGTQKAGEDSQNKRRNETFINFWKYRQFVNKNLGLNTEDIATIDDANKAMSFINEIIKSPEKFKKEKGIHKLNLTHFKTLLKQLRYVIKYYNYNFSDELINILPDKFKPRL